MILTRVIGGKASLVLEAFCSLVKAEYQFNFKPFINGRNYGRGTQTKWSEYYNWDRYCHLGALRHSLLLVMEINRKGP